MISAGCDVGSSTAKAVILEDQVIRSWAVTSVGITPAESARMVLDRALSMAGLEPDSIDRICGTGYGRLEIPFADMNMSEISCHGLGAFHADSSIRTIIDIGGQDCKVIAIDQNGRVCDFIMNNKCAAGTGRSIEILSRLIDVPVESLGTLSMKSHRPIEITNKCGIFMELDVINALLKGRKHRDIALGLSDAVARRVASLAQSVDVRHNVCVTGGVAKNRGVIRQIERRMGCPLRATGIDSQIMGALGAAMFASGSCSYNLKDIVVA